MGGLGFGAREGLPLLSTLPSGVTILVVDSCVYPPLPTNL